MAVILLHYVTENLWKLRHNLFASSRNYAEIATCFEHLRNDEYLLNIANKPYQNMNVSRNNRRFDYNHSRFG